MSSAEDSGSTSVPPGRSGGPVWRPYRRRRWSKEAIVRTIEALRETGADLSYSGAGAARPALHRAAIRLFGSWQAALTAAGVNPEMVRRRRQWTSEAIVERLRQMAARGADLSWTAVAYGPERALAAAAVKKCRFGSWQAALGAAGVATEVNARRIRRWDARTIEEAIRRRRIEGLALNAKAVEREEPALFAAGRRRFGSWNAALMVAGVDPATVMMRRSTPATRGSRGSAGSDTV